MGSLPTISASANPVAYGWQGKELDLESALYYSRARMYDPGTGRFMSRDPIGFSGGDVNLYRYVGNEHIRLTDSSGLYPDDPAYIPGWPGTQGVNQIQYNQGVACGATAAVVVGTTATAFASAASTAGYSAWIRKYPNAGGGGIGIDKNGKNAFRLDWHKFTTKKGDTVNRPHIDVPGKVKHWPWK